MYKKFIFSVLLVLLVQGQIINFGGIKAVDNIIDSDATKKITAATIKIATQEGQLYSGSVTIDVADGESSQIDFYATLAPYQIGCTYSGCFYGWVNNYTIQGEDTILGYGDQSLLIQPVFEFKTN